jgi:hypothetical protein
MADPPRYPNSREPTSIPRWVKVSGIVVAVVVLLIVVMMLIGGVAAGRPQPSSSRWRRWRRTIRHRHPGRAPGGGGHTGPPEGSHR